MTDFTRRTLKINGVDTVVLEAGSGSPLVFLHGAGTVTGFDFAASWARKFHVVIPYHPGFGASADDPAVTEIHDFVPEIGLVYAAGPDGPSRPEPLDLGVLSASGGRFGLGLQGSY